MRIFIFTLILLSGCAEKVSIEEIREFEKICKDKGGLHHIDNRLSISGVCVKRTKLKHNYLGD